MLIFWKNDLCIKTVVAIIIRKIIISPIVVKMLNKYCYIAHNGLLKLSVFILWFVILEILHVNFTTSLQSLLYLCLVLSGFLKHNRNFTCGKSLFLDKTLTRYHHRTMLTWVQNEKFIASWIHRISNIRVQTTGRHPFLILHHPPTLEASSLPIKTIFPLKISHSWIPYHQSFFVIIDFVARRHCSVKKY